VVLWWLHIRASSETAAWRVYCCKYITNTERGRDGACVPREVVRITGSVRNGGAGPALCDLSFGCSINCGGCTRKQVSEPAAWLGYCCEYINKI
jgi:hypothetical protein